jgi:hypothetical protein
MDGISDNELHDNAANGSYTILTVKAGERNYLTKLRNCHWKGYPKHKKKKNYVRAMATNSNYKINLLT